MTAFALEQIKVPTLVVAGEDDALAGPRPAHNSSSKAIRRAPCAGIRL
jgi:hypothetical protein